MAKIQWPTAAGPDVKMLQNLVTELKEVHTRFITALLQITERIKSNTYSIQDLVDIGFTCREAEELLEDWRKDCKARKEVAGRVIAMRLIQDSVANPEKADSMARGTMASATPDVSLEVQLPQRGSKEQLMFLAWLLKNQEPSLTDSQAEVLAKSQAQDRYLQEHWVNIGKLITKLAEDGRPTPPGIGESKPNFSCVFKRRKMEPSTSQSD